MPRTASSAGPNENPRKAAAEDPLGHKFQEYLKRAGLTSEPLAVAFSGGPDSTALLHLACEWSQETGSPVTALTVDHGLRSDSTQEAEAAADTAKALGAHAVVLTWQNEDVQSGIQNAARDARYQLMCDWCRTHAVRHLLLGHHLDDQAATVLMRLHHGSGIGGLAGMRDVLDRDGILLLRPLLDQRKSTLIDWLKQNSIDWVEDPSNRSPDFERNRINEWLTARDQDGQFAGRLARLAARSARAEDALVAMTASAWGQLATQTPDSVSVNLEGWQVLPQEISLRILSRAIGSITGTPPGLAGLEDAMNRLPNQRRINLAGALLSLETNQLRITREPARRQPPGKAFTKPTSGLA